MTQVVVLNSLSCVFFFCYSLVFVSCLFDYVFFYVLSVRPRYLYIHPSPSPRSVLLLFSLVSSYVCCFLVCSFFVYLYFTTLLTLFTYMSWSLLSFFIFVFLVIFASSILLVFVFLILFFFYVLRYHFLFSFRSTLPSLFFL